MTRAQYDNQRAEEDEAKARRTRAEAELVRAEAELEEARRIGHEMLRQAEEGPVLPELPPETPPAV